MESICRRISEEMAARSNAASLASISPDLPPDVRTNLSLTAVKLMKLASYAKSKEADLKWHTNHGEPLKGGYYSRG